MKKPQIASLDSDNTTEKLEESEVIESTFDSTRRVFALTPESERDAVERVLRAINSPNRIRILHYLTNRTASVNTIAAALELPLSTVALHVEVLEEAELIRTEVEPASRGLRKICTRMYDRIVLDLPRAAKAHQQAVEMTIPVGSFVESSVLPTCGLAGDSSIIGYMDDPRSFYEPKRNEAQLIWFYAGHITYRVPNRLPHGVKPETLRLSMEVCSEAPHYDLNWPSDISVWINEVELGVWTSPGDFGGERGRLTPEWWGTHQTQYGLLKEWHVNNQEAAIDGVRLSNIRIDDLRLNEADTITIRIGVKPDAEHIGGLNLFGSRFGNYPQDIILRIGYGTTA